MRFIEYILSTIAPYECLNCTAEGAVLCPACSENLPPIVSRCYRCQRSTVGYRTCRSCRSSSVLASVQAVTLYQEVAKEVVWRLKFERQRACAETIATKLVNLPYEPDEILVHVPTATGRARQRGYDQAALIARSLSRRNGLVHISLLTRIGQQRQVGKTRQERKTQTKNLFLVTGNARNKRIVLVDDVITTGATLETCATVLKTAGAKQVRAVVFAAA